ncbi:DUF3267 domain-containing protein [Pseudobacteroides cellulosolvens]|uniref:DUF3267 domain-containing protein n=1 Tax=Pseudobacteroides cellulosolvens ATCC 35603 = DSM 2933 TaxID=398512 RepID=A0A0L6JIL3_9FIRM|nr:DUF3267 domain-containing protein [Pseudobacteroides cellulosolvens]KNY25538.1 Protein of unknown function DUF3267 [Pseudobacteroides cellulosolvens ATCC 35603 = DSM 2933]
MKFARKMPSTNNELSIQLKSEGWKKIKEPSNLFTTILFALPFAFLTGGIVIAITYLLSPSLYNFINDEHGLRLTIRIDGLFIIFIFAILIFMLLHELIHALLIPNVFQSNNTFWGINGVFGFVFTTEAIKKGRFLVISIMPYLILSICLPILLATFGLLNSFIILLCLINGMGSCVDFMNICLIAFQVPNGCYIKNNGFETYYKG